MTGWRCAGREQTAGHGTAHLVRSTAPKLPARGPTAEAIRYALNHWDGLERFLDDGRIELDNNSVERSMRPVAL